MNMAIAIMIGIYPKPTSIELKYVKLDEDFY